MGHDYNSVEWSSLVEYDPTSPSGIVWATDRGKMLVGDVAGSKVLNKTGTPKCWDLRYNGKLWKVHRIVWILLEGSIENSLVINHIDNNPFNNVASNLELVSQTTNMRRASCHTGTKLQVNNTTGFTGVSSVVRDGSLFAYRADVRNGDGSQGYLNFPISRYGEDLALKLANTSREHFINLMNINGAGYAQDTIHI